MEVIDGAVVHPPQASKAPGPRGNLVLGHVGEIERDPLAFLPRCRAEYGDIVRLRFFVWPGFLLAHPDHVKHVLQDRHTAYDKDNVDWRLMKLVLDQSLLTSDGEVWLKQRRLMQPAFHREQVAGFGRIMTDEADRMLTRWRDRGDDDRPLDVAAEMGRLAMDVVTRALFGTQVDEDAASVGEAVATLNRDFIENGFSLQGLVSLVTGRPALGARRSLATLDRIVGKIIADRRAGRDDGGEGDLLSMLLSARDEESGEGMDDRQLRNEVLTLFVAGHETTSNALSWAWYLLSDHPEVFERMRAELDDVLGDRLPTIDDVPRLTYTRMVLDEAMRLYPPAWATSRNATEDDEIGGYPVRRGSVVLLSPWVTHRHPEFWDDPQRFDPERFTPERSSGRSRFAYFPFGGGPHLCIGQTFALTEGVLVLAAVAQRCALELKPGHQVVPEPGVTVRPRGGLPMRVAWR